jgi:hypothetical protein
VPLAGKVVSQDSYTPHFITGATYTPAEGDTMEKWKLLPKAREKKLFERRIPISVLSLARPYGGSLPQADRSVLGAVSGGPVGDPYLGSKLVGIADKTQIAEIPTEFTDSPTQVQDDEGRILRTEHTAREDYLH